MLLFRPPLMRFGRPGVVPANFATGGDEPSPLDNDLPSLTDRASAEWLWVLLSPLPASGTTEVNDDGGYALIDPADGTYTQAYRGLVMPLAGSPQVYESTITTTVGEGGVEPDTTAPTMVGDIAVSLLTTTSYTTSIDAATDDVGVTAYQVSQDGGSTWTDKGTTRTHSHTGRTPSATDQVRWRARDAAGNWATPLAAAVILLAAPDTTAPVMVGAISVSSLTATSYTSSIEAATDDVGVVAYQVSHTGGADWIDQGLSLTHNHTGRTPESTDAVRWRARDAAGNWATPLAANVTLLEAPIVVPTPPAYGGGKGSDDAAWRDFAEFKERMALEADEAEDMEILEVISVLAAVGAIA